MTRFVLALGLLVAATVAAIASPKKGDRKPKSKRAAPAALVGPRDWAQWGGSPTRNNTPEGTNIPTDWQVGEFDRKTRQWNSASARNIKWVAELGTTAHGNAVVANGKVLVGTDNGAGWLKRYPAKVDLGCLLCFSEADGEFLWQHSSEKLPTGLAHDWPYTGICSTALVEGERLWFVTSRGEVACLDTQGFRDGENDGPFKGEKVEAADEADAIWYLDMMGELGVSQHNMANCSVTAAGDVLFVNTSNGVDEGHINLPSPEAPSFIAVDKNTGKVLWTDNSPGKNVLHGQWCSPSYAILGGVPQVLFGGGDGWLYSFRGIATADGKPDLLWKFDCNPKVAKHAVGRKSTRNHIIGMPVIHDGLVYVAVGEDPEHLAGQGHLWCIDPTKRGDVSPQLVFNVKDPDTPIPPKRFQAVVEEEGDFVRDNPNSAAVWHYDVADRDVNGDGQIGLEETMHRTIGSPAIKDGLLYIADISGILHCLDAKTGKVHWTHDMLCACWGSPLIVDGKVYIGNEDGDVCIFKASADPKQAMQINEEGELAPITISMESPIYTTPLVANNVLYIANQTHLFAIVNEGK